MSRVDGGLDTAQDFFYQVGHQTMYAFMGNKHFFTKSCHRQTYQNYEQPPQRLQNSFFSIKNLRNLSGFFHFFKNQLNLSEK